MANSSCIRMRPRLLNIVSIRRLAFASVILVLSLAQLLNSLTGIDNDVPPMVGIKDEQVMILERQTLSSTAEKSANKEENINHDSLTNHQETKENDRKAEISISLSSAALSSLSPLQSPFLLSPATKCRLELQNQTARILVENYVHRGRPHLQNVLQIEKGVHYIILSFTPFTKWRKIWYTRQPQVLWKCHYYHPHHHGSSNETTTTTTTVAQMVKQDGDAGPDIILTCHNTQPQLLMLDMVSFTHPFNQEQNLVYNVSGYRICDELMAQEGPAPQQRAPWSSSSAKSSTLKSKRNNDGDTVRTTATPVQKIAAMTTIRGSQARALVEPWVEYHRIVGVDHFWIFINDYYWDTSSSLPIRPYITYVPCDYCRTNATGHATLPFHVCSEGRNHWQQGQNLESLYRAKQYNLDWLLLIDVDEYLYVVPNHNKKSTGKPLLDFIDIMQNKSESTAGFYFKSIPFGRNVYISNNDTSAAEFADGQATPTNMLLLDYTWRSSRTWDDYTWSRRKLLIQPRHVRSVGVHDILSQHNRGGPNDVTILWLNAATQMRLHHYKNPQLGVFEPDGKIRRRAKRKGQSSIVQDTTLVNAFRDQVVAAMQHAALKNTG